MRKNIKILSISLALLIILIVAIYFIVMIKIANNKNIIDKQISDDKTKAVIDQQDEPNVNVSYMDIDKQKKDCEDKGGIFNDCGSSCNSSGICLDVCVPVCIPKKETYGKDMNWQEYSNESLEFSILKPKISKLEMLDSNEFKLEITEDREQTASSPGLIMLISKQSFNPQESLESHLSREIEQLNSTEKLTSSLTANRGGSSLVSYSYNTKSTRLFKHLIISVYPGKYFKLSYFVVNYNYLDLANKIIGSFNILDEDKMKISQQSIKAESPKLLQSVSSPFKISGEVRGSWFFENQFIVSLTDWDGKIISETTASSSKNWMTEDFIPFSAEIEFEIPDNLYSTRANLILQKNNASGFPEHDDSLEYVIYLSR